MHTECANFAKEYVDLPRLKKGSEKTQLMEFLTIAHIDSKYDKVASDGDLYVDVPIEALINNKVTRGGKYVWEDLDRVFDQMSDLKIMTPGKKFVVFQKMSIDPVKKSIQIKIDGDIAPYFVQLRKNFGSIQLRVMFSELSTFYARKLYKYLRPKLHKDSTFWKFTIPLKDFREAMGFEAEGTWKRYDVMKSKFLKPALAEIERNSDIKVSFNEIRAYRKGVVELTFNISLNINYTPSLGLSSGCVNEISEVDASFLLEIGFKHPTRIDDAIKNTSLEAVERTIEQLRKEMKKGEVKNPPAFFNYILPDWSGKHQIKIQKREALIAKDKSFEEAKEEAEKAVEMDDKKRDSLFKKWKSKNGGKSFKAMFDKVLKENPSFVNFTDYQMEVIVKNEWVSAWHDQLELFMEEM